MENDTKHRTVAVCSEQGLKKQSPVNRGKLLHCSEAVIALDRDW